MSLNIALIGSGNPLFKDEGIALFAAKYLKENYLFTPPISIIDGGTLGLDLVSYLQEYDQVIIANTASDDRAVKGSITVKNDQEFLEDAGVKKTANEVVIIEMLQVCSLADHMAEIHFISIVPEDIISVEVGLSETLTQCFESYIDTILQLLSSLHVSAEKSHKNQTLKDIIYLFSHPSIEHNRSF